MTADGRALEDEIDVSIILFVFNERGHLVDEIERMTATTTHRTRFRRRLRSRSVRNVDIAG